MPVFNNALAGAAGSGGAAGYTIERSLRFNDSDSAHLSRTFSAGNSQKWTWAAWVKRNKLGGYQTLFGHVSGTHGQHYIDFGGDKIRFTRYVSSNEAALETQALYRDVSAWMHVCAIWDVGNSTANHRQRLFVNGVEVTEFSTRTNPSQNYSGGVISTAIEHHISKVLSQNYGAFQLADIHFLDGIVAGISTDDASGSVTGTPNAAYLTDFGKFDADTGVWNPIEYTGDYTTAGSGTPYSASSTMANASAVFDGNTSNYGSSAMNSGSYQTVTTQPITFTLNNGSFTYNTNNCGATGGSNYRYLRLTRQSDGVTTELTSTDCNGWTIPNAWTNITISKIEWKRWSSYENVSAVYVDGTMLVDSGAPAGVNGFHLDFSDNSSNAALGFDANVEGTRYSASVTGIRSNSSPANMFDGSTSTFALGENGGGIVTFTPQTAIPYTAASGGVEVNFHSSSQGDRVRINGGSWYNQTTVNVGGWETVSTGDGTITSMDFQDNGNNAEAAIRAIRVNGTILTDPSGANDWTVNNFESGAVSTISSPNRPTWGSASNWTRSNSNYDANYTGSGYTGIQASLSANTTYHFYLTFKDTSGSYGGWYFTDSSSAPSNTVPNELGSNSIGLRTGHTSAGTHGNYATENGTNNGSNELTLTALQSSGSGEHSVEFVINTTAGKVWARKVGNTNWVGGGNPSNSSSTASFLIPTGAQYFGYMGYQSGTTADFKTSAASASAADIDYFRDSPTNGNTADDTGAGGEVSANYCTMNPLANYLTLANGNLDVSQSSAAHHTSYATLGVSSGKWYWEITKNDGNNASATSIGLGVAKTSFTSDSSTYISSTDTIIGYMQSGVGLYDGDGYSRLVTALGSGVEHTTGTWMLAFDFDNGKGWIGKDGTWLSDTTAGNEGNPATGANPSFNGFVSGETYVPMVGMYAATSVSANFGQRAWKYTAPSGFKALCTANLPTPDVTDGSAYFDTKTWQGTGSTLSITGYKFSPDFVWIKNRTDSSSHHIYDTVRGVEKRLASNSSSGEDDFGSSDPGSSLTSFNSDGFTVGDFNGINGSSDAMVAWAWKAGDSNTPVSAGSLNSYVYDQSQTWSTLDTWPTASYSTDPDHAFNGSWGSMDTVDFWFSNGASTVDLSNLATALGTGVTNIKIWIFDRQGTVTVTVNNATANESQQNAGSEISIDHDGSAITTFTIQGTDSSYWGIGGIKVNGKLLVDSNVSVTNVPSIASTYRANPSAGFSIVTWTGTGSAGTLAHGLQKKPELIITKVHGDSTYADNWPVYHSAYGAGTYTYLNDTRAAPASYTDFFDGVEPTSSVFSVGSDNSDNTKNLIAYCFSPVESYSAFGSFEGNGQSTGPFVYTGFKPAFLLVKSADTAYDWFIYDTTRQSYNEYGPDLRANRDYAEANNPRFDILSNGFKVHTSSVANNANAVTYIYAAFAEHPFKTARAR